MFCKIIFRNELDLFETTCFITLWHNATLTVGIRTLSIMKHCKMSLSMMLFSITTRSITTFPIMLLSIMKLSIMTLCITTFIIMLLNLRMLSIMTRSLKKNAPNFWKSSPKLLPNYDCLDWKLKAVASHCFWMSK